MALQASITLSEEQVRDAFDESLEGTDDNCTINYARMTKLLNDRLRAAGQQERVNWTEEDYDRVDAAQSTTQAGEKQ